MLKSLLIANRGEIARRIIRTADRLGIRSVAVYSDADARTPMVREANLAVPIGPAPVKDSYLDQAKILAAAAATGVEAIHPGYGFLSENAEFAEAVQRAGLIWVGAPPAAIRAMGHKDAAKALMQSAGVPVTPGYLGEDQSPDRLQSEADALGYPVLIKAVAGGGGKGMRRVDVSADFRDALESCRREAASSFGDDRVLVEKYILGPRHIEVQVFGDTHGQVVHLFERDCSLQRRHQKVIEEAPAPGMDPATRAAVCEAAVKAARAVNYVGAGTIEFIADASEGLRPDRIWFMEMNTRLQVEHPVTEAITGQDLVEWQLRVASGEPLPKRQDELAIQGWAMEARLYAENPATGFLPSVGPLRRLRFPAGARIDAGVEEGGSVTSFYDPMIAKLIVHETDRPSAAAALSRAAGAVQVWPLRTNAAFLARAAAESEFVVGAIDTGFIERNAASLAGPPAPEPALLQAAAASLCGVDEDDPWTGLRGLRLNGPPESRIALEVGGAAFVVDVTNRPSDEVTIAQVGAERVAFLAGEAFAFGPLRHVGTATAGALSDGVIVAPMPGRVVCVDAAAGDRVKAGQKIVAIEAMKMELALAAPFDGKVINLRAVVGQQVEEGAILAVIEKEQS